MGSKVRFPGEGIPGYRGKSTGMQAYTTPVYSMYEGISRGEDLDVSASFRIIYLSIYSSDNPTWHSSSLQLSSSAGCHV